jgi:hypothetical protein
MAWDQRDGWNKGMAGPKRDGWNRGIAGTERWLEQRDDCAVCVAVCKRIQWDSNKTKTLSSAVSFDSLASHFGLASYVLSPIPPVFTTEIDI